MKIKEEAVIMEKKETSYLNIVNHYEQCFEKYGDNHKGVDWPKIEDTAKRYQVMSELFLHDTWNSTENPTILDFGCGLGHFYDYILEKNIKVIYEGLDLSEKFVKRCREKYPECKFWKKNILESNESIQQYDYIILNGVLTEKRELTYEEMLAYTKELIKKVYKYCKYGIAFNVMSKNVDWEREDLFHLPLDVLSEFLVKEVTRDFVIRHDYKLYEYTVYVYKRGHIDE